MRLFRGACGRGRILTLRGEKGLLRVFQLVVPSTRSVDLFCRARTRKGRCSFPPTLLLLNLRVACARVCACLCACAVSVIFLFLSASTRLSKVTHQVERPEYYFGLPGIVFEFRLQRFTSNLVCDKKAARGGDCCRWAQQFSLTVPPTTTARSLHRSGKSLGVFRSLFARRKQNFVYILLLRRHVYGVRFFFPFPR